MAKKGFAVTKKITSARKFDSNPSLCRAAIELELANRLGVVPVPYVCLILVERTQLKRTLSKLKTSILCSCF